MHHNDVVRLLHTCPCPCHTAKNEQCWCRDARRKDPLDISHNDRVKTFGHCQCDRHMCDNTTTAPDIAAAIERLGRDDRERRIRTGRPTSADVAHIARHPHKYPHLWR